MQKQTWENIIQERLKKVTKFRAKCYNNPTEYKMSYSAGANLMLYGRDATGNWSVWDSTGKWIEEEYDEQNYFTQ